MNDAAQITSMTGFGSGKIQVEGALVRATVRTVNGRFLDVQVRCPSAIQELESRIRERVQQVLTRGKVSVSIEWEAVGSGGEPVLNEVTAARYAADFQRLAEIAGIGGEVDIAGLARMPGVFSTDTAAFDAATAAEPVQSALDAALVECDAMRRSEGETLAADLRLRIAELDESNSTMERLADHAREQYLIRLRERVASLLEPGAIDEDRLAMEVVMLAERSDITEEIVRFRSHTAQFVESLDSGGDVGRRMNFLLQEMHREANTISSKASDTEIVHCVLGVKEGVERMREQVQNLA